MNYKKFNFDKEYQLYNHRLLPEYSDNNARAYVGRYGELITLYWVEEARRWVFNNQTEGLFDIYIDDEDTIHKLLMYYCIKGNKDFDYKKKGSCRDIYLYQVIHKTYDKYVKTKNTKLLIILERTIKDLEIFRWNKTKYKDWIIAGFCRGLDKVPKDEIKFFLELRKKVKRKKISDDEDFLDFINGCKDVMIEEE